MDNSMAWIEYNQAYKQHLRGAMAANGSNLHHAHHPSPGPGIHHAVAPTGSNGANPYSHHSVQNHSAMMAAHHYRHNTMGGGRSNTSTPAPTQTATSQHSLTAQQPPTPHQQSQHTTTTTPAATAAAAATAQPSPYSQFFQQTASMLSSCSTNPMFPTNDGAGSTQYPGHRSTHSSQSTNPISVSPYSQNSHSKTVSGSSTTKSAKHNPTQSAASSLASSAGNSSFDSSCYYRSAKDAYQNGSNAWPFLNAQSHQAQPSTSGACNVGQSIHHTDLANQTKCAEALASTQSSSSSQSSASRIPASTPNPASMAASFNTFDHYDHTPNHLNAFMNQNHWNHHSNAVSKQRCDASISQARWKEHEQHRQQQLQSSQHHSSQHHAQQFGATSDISPSLSSTTRYPSTKPSSVADAYPGTNYSDYPPIGASDIFHNVAAAAWQQNYAMAKATYKQQCATNEAMMRGTPASGNAKSSSVYPPNYGQPTQSTHFGAGTTSSYFPPMVPNFPTDTKFHRDTDQMYFVAMAAKIQQQKHRQQQQIQQQNSHNLHTNQQNFYHNQNQNHSEHPSGVHDPYSSAMMAENHTQQLMNYSNSFFPTEQTQQSQPDQVTSTPTTSNKPKKRTRRTKASANAAAITQQQQQQQSQQVAASTVLPEYSAYSNYSQCNGGNLSQQAIIQQQQQQRSLSRCSSVSSQHHQPQHQHRNSESSNSHYNNYSPATTTGHSPYHSGGSSQTPCLGAAPGPNAFVNGADSGYYSSGGTVFPNQAPTPTPGGYPTPPSSVGQNSNPRCNSNGELSPYSSNSMSSTMSQSYTNPGSSKTSNSQISPVHSHDNVDPSQYHSSCMMQKSDDAFYQGQAAPFADGAYSENGNVQAATNNELYLDYVNPESAVNDPAYVQYDNAHYDSAETYPDSEMELTSCAKVPTVAVNSSPEAVMTIADTEDYHQTHIQATQNGHHSESFNLNFDSVIPSIDNSAVVSTEVESDNPSPDDSIPSVDGLLPPIDDLNHHFIDHQQQQQQQQQQPQQPPQATQSQAEYSHNLLSNDSSSQQQHLQNSSILDDDEPMVECSQIHSIIESLPNDGVLEDNNSSSNIVNTESLIHSTVLPSLPLQNGTMTAENVNKSDESSIDCYPSDLAPLLADSSKIALMESTFKSPAHGDELPKLGDEHCADDVDDDDDGEDSKLKYLDEFLISEGVHESITETIVAPTNGELQRDNNVSQNVPDMNIVIQPSMIDMPATNNQFDIGLSKQTNNNKKNKRKLSDVQQNTNIVFNTASTTPMSEPVKVTTTTTTQTTDPNPAKKRKVAVVHPKSKETKKEIKIDFSEPIKQEKKSITKTKEKCKDKTNESKIKDSKEWLKEKKSKKKMTISEIITNKIEHTEKKKAKIIEKVKISSNNSKKSKTNTLKNANDSKGQLEQLSKIPNSKIQESKENLSKPNQTNGSLKPKTICNKKIIPKIEISPMPTIPVMIKQSIPGTIIDINVQAKKLPKPKQISPKPKKVPIKEVAISPKPAAGTLFNNSVNSNKTTSLTLQRPQNVLSPVGASLTVPSQPSKAKTPPVSFGAPTTTQTLIVNQNGPQSYQVQPMTNASPMMLISIHPTLHPTAAASSTFILNTQNSIQNANANSNTQVGTGSSLTPQSSVSRRKSQDKKLTTVREGLMRTSDFVVAEDEAQLSNPVIWRIEGKSLLQRFESTDQNGQTVYVNTSSYSAWNPTVREKYLGLDVRIIGCNRSRTVVEKIGLTSAKKSESNVIVPEKETVERSSDNRSPLNGSSDNRSQHREDLSRHFDNFEVYVQTLVSQALDPNFIAEIVKENDDYFVSRMNAIDDLCIDRKTRFLTKQKWDSNLVKCIDSYPNNQIHQQSDVGDLRCRLCHDNWSTKILQFEGEVYNLKTLEVQESTNLDVKQTKLALCDSCTDKAFLYSKMHHQKYNFYINCKTKVQNIISQDENKDSREILDECLGDNEWIKELFSELESMLVSCERYSK